MRALGNLGTTLFLTTLSLLLSISCLGESKATQGPAHSSPLSAGDSWTPENLAKGARTFNKLRPTEKFTTKWADVDHGQLDVYGVDQATQTRRRIGGFLKPMIQNIQYSNDFRRLFFVVPEGALHLLYFVDGDSGNIRQIASMPTAGYRVSRDGKLICFGNSSSTGSVPVVRVLTVDGAEFGTEIAWEEEPMGDFSIYLKRLPNTSGFEVLIVGEGGSQVADGILEEGTSKIYKRWDYRDRKAPLPKPDSEFLYDDLVFPDGAER